MQRQHSLLWRDRLIVTVDLQHINVGRLQAL